MENENSLMSLIEIIVEMVMKEVVKNLKEVRFKQWKNRRSRLCYECRKMGHIACFCPQQIHSGDSRDDKIDEYYVRHVMKPSEKDDNELKRTMKEQVMRSPSKGDIGIDGFNGVVFQQIVNRKEHWNGKVEDIPSKKCVVKEKTIKKEKEYIPDIRSVNRNVVNNGVKLQMIKRKMSRKVGNNEYADLGESALRIDNAKVKVMESLDEDGSNPKKLDMSCVVGENEIK
ncbi:5509_t:CDS:2, partial [Racocetra persica]